MQFKSKPVETKQYFIHWCSMNLGLIRDAVMTSDKFEICSLCKNPYEEVTLRRRRLSGIEY